MVRHRAAVVIVQDGNLALIERRRDGRTYHTFPGGGIKLGETPAEAAAREAWEELGVLVATGANVATVTFAGSIQHFIRAEITGGFFGSGEGKEMTGDKPDKRGSYLPVWLPLVDLGLHEIIPHEVADVIAQVERDGWPDAPFAFTDEIAI